MGSVSDGSTKRTGRYRMSCRSPMEGWGGGDDRLKPGYGELFWLAHTSKWVPCPPVGFQSCQAPPVTGTTWDRLGKFASHRHAPHRDCCFLFPDHRGLAVRNANMTGSITGLTLSGPGMAPQTRLGVEGPLLNRVAAIRRLLNNRVLRTYRTAPTEPWDRPCC